MSENTFYCKRTHSIENTFYHVVSRHHFPANPADDFLERESERAHARERDRARARASERERESACARKRENERGEGEREREREREKDRETLGKKLEMASSGETANLFLSYERIRSVYFRKHVL